MVGSTVGLIRSSWSELGSEVAFLPQAGSRAEEVWGSRLGKSNWSLKAGQGGREGRMKTSGWFRERDLAGSASGGGRVLKTDSQALALSWLEPKGGCAILTFSEGVGLGKKSF